MDGWTIFWIVSAVVGAYAQYQQGKATEYEYKAQAEEEKKAAKDAEIQRRQKLIRALAQRNVASAASGTALEGTDIALINRDFREYSLDTLTGEAMTSARVRSLRAAGKNAKRIGILNASSTLLAGAAQASSPTSTPSTTSTSSSGGGLGRIKK